MFFTKLHDEHLNLIIDVFLERYGLDISLDEEESELWISSLPLNSYISYALTLEQVMKQMSQMIWSFLPIVGKPLL